MFQSFVQDLEYSPWSEVTILGCNCPQMSSVIEMVKKIVNVALTWPMHMVSFLLYSKFDFDILDICF